MITGGKPPIGGKPPAGYSYETLGGDVCKTCGCVVANENKHNPCPILTLTARIAALEGTP